MDGTWSEGGGAEGVNLAEPGDPEGEGALEPEVLSLIELAELEGVMLMGVGEETSLEGMAEIGLAAGVKPEIAFETSCCINTIILRSTGLAVCWEESP